LANWLAAGWLVVGRMSGLPDMVEWLDSMQHAQRATPTRLQQTIVLS